jgi:putative Mn2+ efflux pump MntP
MSLETILVAIGLGMDTFAVGMGSGAVFKAPIRRSVFRLSFHFGFFQSLLFLAGYFAGAGIVDAISAWDHLVALCLLLFVGLRMIWEGISGRDEGAERSDPSRGWQLVMLSLATSIDALAVGLSFGVLQRGVLFPALLIGGISCVMTLVGIFLGRRLKATFGGYAEILGGLILIGIGVKVFLEHTV